MLLQILYNMYCHRFNFFSFFLSYDNAVVVPHFFFNLSKKVLHCYYEKYSYTMRISIIISLFVFREQYARAK